MPRGMNQRLKDIPEMLSAAVALATPDFRTDAGRTADDVRSDIRRGDWEMAFGILEDMSDEHPQSVGFWQCLADVAGLMHLDGSVAWCQWRKWESLHGVIRADLVLAETEAGGRSSAIPGDGTLRPMWDIGHRGGSGEPALAIARLRVEFADAVAPGQDGSIRLTPLNPPGWRHLAPGDLITMHETALAIGVAEITEILPPVPSGR